MTLVNPFTTEPKRPEVSSIGDKGLDGNPAIEIVVDILGTLLLVSYDAVVGLIDRIKKRRQVGKLAISEQVVVEHVGDQS